jgi:molecular chaperone GrpE
VKRLFKKFFNHSKTMNTDNSEPKNSYTDADLDAEAADEAAADAAARDAEAAEAAALEAEAAAAGDAARANGKDPTVAGNDEDAEFDVIEGVESIEALEKKFAADTAKLRDALARAVADHENYRRRVNREKEDLRKFATQEVLEDFIPILDNFAAGITAAEKHPEAAPVTDGFKMIAAQINRVLESHGLVEVSPLGEEFDPNFHESVSITPHETIPENHVAAVLRTGYRLHDRLLRPASVILSSGPAKN